jgi:hypothetical protein
MVWFQEVGGKEESRAGVEMCEPTDDEFNAAEGVPLEAPD